MLKISWNQKVTNQEVLNIIREERSMISSISQRKHNCIGHVLRHDSILLNRIIEGRIKGKRGKVRKKQQMVVDNMEKEMYVNLKRTAEDRASWIERRKQQMDVPAITTRRRACQVFIEKYMLAWYLIVVRSYCPKLDHFSFLFFWLANLLGISTYILFFLILVASDE